MKLFVSRILIFFFLIVGLLFAQNNVAIKRTIDKYTNTKLFKHASWSVTARYLDNGEEIVSHNSNVALAPASNLKLVTTAAALDILGTDYKFETKLYYDGEISREGVLKGNIYIVGGGDPTLGYDLVSGALSLNELMTSWINAIRESGINSINGNIIADDLIYDRIPVPYNWSWIDLGNYYAASTSALTINNNLYFLYFKPGDKVGDVAEVIRTEPTIENLVFTNYMKTGKKGSGDNGYVFNAPLQFNATLRGTIPQGHKEFSIKGSIPNPPLFAAQYLKHTLEQNSVFVSGKASVLKNNVNYDDKKIITITRSPSLENIVYIINKKSDNLYTEMLLRAIGLKAKGEGSVEKGIEAVEDYLLNNNLDADELIMHDGCGLSRFNAITSNLFVELLSMIVNKPYFDAFYNSLAVVGDKNDISSYSNYGIGTLLEKNAHIKSGVIEGVRSYSGYLKNKSGRTIVFSMIANNFNGSGSAVSNIHKEIMIKLAEIE